jgi:hypothetical protein
MKSIKKREFIEILKLVSDILESNDIDYEIPYCFLDKDTFNYQDIIVPNTIDTSNLIMNLNIADYQDSLDVFSGDIEDFRFNFIKVPLDYKFNAFYHYCWNFYPILIKAIFHNLGLVYDYYGLHYMVNNTKKITLSKNLQDIMEFLDIDFKSIYGINIPDKRQLYQVVIDSYYFSFDAFEINKLKELDPMYKQNEKYYTEFKSIMPHNKLEVDRREMINIYDEYFNSGLIEKLSKIQLKGDFPEVRQLKEDLKKVVSKDDIGIVKEEAEKRKKVIEAKKKIKIPRLKDLSDINFKEEGDTIRMLDKDKNE